MKFDSLYFPIWILSIYRTKGFVIAYFVTPKSRRWKQKAFIQCVNDQFQFQSSIVYDDAFHWCKSTLSVKYKKKHICQPPKQSQSFLLDRAVISVVEISLHGSYSNNKITEKSFFQKISFLSSVLSSWFLYVGDKKCVSKIFLTIY